MNIIERITSPTPSFFRKLRNIGLVLAGVGTTIVTAPVVLPPVLMVYAGYALLAGSVIGAVSQLTTHTETKGGTDG
jgi:hypothetical protein